MVNGNLDTNSAKNADSFSQTAAGSGSVASRSSCGGICSIGDAGCRSGCSSLAGISLSRWACRWVDTVAIAVLVAVLVVVVVVGAATTPEAPPERCSNIPAKVKKSLK